MASVRTGDDVRLWSRQGKDLTSRFPDVQAALQAQLDSDCVLDGEIVVWTGDRLDFGQLQRRLVTSPAKARSMVAERPASFVVFDVLAVNGVDVRSQRWSTRHRRLEPTNSVVNRRRKSCGVNRTGSPLSVRSRRWC
jgi:ATP-dependent DNA ligase